MSDLKLNIEEVLRFFRWLYPRGPWAPVALDPTRPGKYGDACRVFSPGEETDLATWLFEYHVKGWNLYYHVNEVVPSITTTAEKTQIKTVHFLQVDIDPRATETPEEAALRIAPKLVNYRLPPSMIMRSGNGHNALWRLRVPYTPKSVVDAEATIESRCWWLHNEMEAPTAETRNINRILRIPGTVNRPTKAKIAKGRVPVMAGLAEFNDNEYDLEDFGVFVDQRVKTASVQVGQVDKIDDLGRLQISEDLKHAIVSGQYKDSKTGGDRSRETIRVALDLLRSGQSFEIIAAIISDPRYKISGHVLDQGNVPRAIQRTIDNAYQIFVNEKLEGDKARGEALTDMNSRFALVGVWGGAPCVLYEQSEDRPPLRWSDTDLALATRGQFVMASRGEKLKEVPIAKWWLDHPSHRAYDRVVFEPGREVPTNHYNLWRGFSVDPKPGDRHLSFLEHVFEIGCSGNQDHYDYLLRWLARMVQFPAEPGHVAIALQGGQGTGKGTIARTFVKLFSPHSRHITDSDLVLGKHNSMLEGCVFLFADEAFYAGDKAEKRRMKTLITEPTIAIHHKYARAEEHPNYVHMMLAANDDWFLDVDVDDRRFLILEVSSKRVGDHEYWKTIKSDLDDGGYANLLFSLATLDISSFNPRVVPRGEAHRKQVIASYTGITRWFLNRLNSGVVIPQQRSWTDPVRCEDVAKHLRDEIRSSKSIRADATAMGVWFQKNLGDLVKRVHEIGEWSDEHGNVQKRLAYFYRFAPLVECKRAFTKNCNGPETYDTDGIEEPTNVVQIESARKDKVF